MKEQVIDILKRAGYRPESRAIVLADVEFGFDAVLSGPDGQSSLVLMATAGASNSVALRRRVRNLVTALARTESARPIVLVLLAEDSLLVSDLNDVCYTVVVGPHDDLDEALRPLLPLRIPGGSRPRTNAEDLLRERIGPAVNEPMTSSLLAAARLSAQDVEQVLRTALERAAGEEG